MCTLWFDIDRFETMLIKIKILRIIVEFYILEFFVTLKLVHFIMQ